MRSSCRGLCLISGGRRAEKMRDTTFGLALVMFAVLTPTPLPSCAGEPNQPVGQVSEVKVQIGASEVKTSDIDAGDVNHAELRVLADEVRKTRDLLTKRAGARDILDWPNLVGLSAFIFGVWQLLRCRSRTQLFTIHLRKLWDKTRSSVPLNATTEELIELAENTRVADALRKRHEDLVSIFREINTVYFSELGKKATYKLVKNMISAGQIRSHWVLDLVLAQIPDRRRDNRRDRECHDDLSRRRPEDPYGPHS